MIKSSAEQITACDKVLHYGCARLIIHQCFISGLLHHEVKELFNYIFKAKNYLYIFTPTHIIQQFSQFKI